MKSILVFGLLLLSSIAEAQTPVQLQVPNVDSYNGATYRCAYQTCQVNWSNRNDLIVTGFTPDGNYLNVAVRGWVAVGVQRGLQYHYWCGTMQFDLSGVLVNINVVDTHAAYVACAQPDGSATFTNPGGYEGYSTPVYSEGGYFEGWAPDLALQ